MFKHFVIMLMITAGVFLVLGSLLYLRLNNTNIETASLPRSIAGELLTSSNIGPQAVTEITRMHQKDFAASFGAMGQYGEQSQITLWVARFTSSTIAYQMVEAMGEKISSGNSPFSPTGENQMDGHTVYALDGMGQKHFYFQSGESVVWLATNVEMADRALRDVLNFYP